MRKWYYRVVVEVVVVVGGGGDGGVGCILTPYLLHAAQSFSIS